MSADYVPRILKAPVYDIAVETPLDEAPALGAAIGARVLLKREDLQPVFSFKIRGAYTKMARLSAAERARGVIAASAGNHAQGVAASAAKLGVRAIIVMPATTPSIKVDAVRSHGAEVILEGDDYDAAHAKARALARDRNLTFVHPYDDPDVIAGQGTVAMEIFRQHRGPLSAIFVPVGGGGLIAGIAAYAKWLEPSIRIIGVEPNDAGCLHAALEAGERVTLPKVGIFVDGVAVRQVGEAPFEIAKDLVDEVVLVGTDQVCAAVKDVFEATRSVMEPAGALAVAGLKAYAATHDVRGETFIAITSGANVNFDRLRYVTERAAVGEQREALYAVEIPERPGAFRDFCEKLGEHAITEFNYRYGDDDRAQIFVGLSLPDGARETRATLTAQLAEGGYDVRDLSENEVAGLHVRFMVGGRSSAIARERIVRFVFPERPAAFQRFLHLLGGRWNITLFHYRNHGSAWGRVLAGFEVPEAEDARFDAFLDELGYRYQDETENPAYRLFLGTGRDASAPPATG